MCSVAEYFAETVGISFLNLGCINNKNLHNIHLEYRRYHYHRVDLFLQYINTDYIETC